MQCNCGRTEDLKEFTDRQTGSKIYICNRCLDDITKKAIDKRNKYEQNVKLFGGYPTEQRVGQR